MTEEINKTYTSNSLYNDSTGVIAFAEQLKQELINWANYQHVTEELGQNRPNLQNELNNLFLSVYEKFLTFLNDGDASEEAINTWKEIENFLADYTDEKTLASIVAELNNKIESRLTVPLESTTGSSTTSTMTQKAITETIEASKTFTTGEKVNNVGIDTEPTAESDNLVKSSGIFSSIDSNIKSFIPRTGTLFELNGEFSGYHCSNVNTGYIHKDTSTHGGYIINVTGLTKIKMVSFSNVLYTNRAACYSDIPDESTFLGMLSLRGSNPIELTEGTKFIVISVEKTSPEVSFYIPNRIYPCALLQCSSHFKCSSEENQGSKQIVVSHSSETIQDGRFTVLMQNKTTVASSLNTVNRGNGETTTKEIYYNGSRANLNNTWDAGEILDIVYDNTNDRYNATSFNYKILDGTITADKLADNAIEQKYHYIPAIINGGSADATLLKLGQDIIKGVELIGTPPEGFYVKGCGRVRQLHCTSKVNHNINLRFDIQRVINGEVINDGYNTISVSEYDTSDDIVELVIGDYWKLYVSVKGIVDNKSSFSHSTNVWYDGTKNNPYQLVLNSDVLYIPDTVFRDNSIEGKKLNDKTITESKLSQEVQEKINTGNGYLYNKKLVTLCDSMGASSQWQEPLAELTGCIYSKELNDNHYSVGGTKTLYAPEMGNDAQGRAIKLVEEQLIDPDVIIYENVNDNSGLQDGSETDEPFMKTQQLMLEVSPSITSESDAIDYWDNNFSSIIGQYTPQAGTILGIPFVTNNGVQLKITGGAIADGTLSINLTMAGKLSIAITAGDTISSIIAKILEYDWNGYIDIVNPNDSDAVIFTKLDGNTPAVFSVDTGETGITYQKSTGVTGQLYVWRYFYGHDLSKWSDSTYWKDSISRWSMWKGIIEYLQTHFPKTMIYWMAPQTFTFNYNNLSDDQLFPDGTPNYYYIWNHNIMYSQLRQKQRAFCNAYNIPFIELVKNSGINPMNASYFCNVNNVHPKTTAYQRWAEIIAQQID